MCIYNSVIVLRYLDLILSKSEIFTEIIVLWFPIFLRRIDESVRKKKTAEFEVKIKLINLIFGI